MHSFAFYPYAIFILVLSGLVAWLMVRLCRLENRVSLLKAPENPTKCLLVIAPDVDQGQDLLDDWLSQDKQEEEDVIRRFNKTVGANPSAQSDADPEYDMVIEFEIPKPTSHAGCTAPDKISPIDQLLHEPTSHAGCTGPDKEA